VKNPYDSYNYYRQKRRSKQLGTKSKHGRLSEGGIKTTFRGSLEAKNEGKSINQGEDLSEGLLEQKRIKTLIERKQKGESGSRGTSTSPGHPENTPKVSKELRGFYASA